MKVSRWGSFHVVIYNNWQKGVFLTRPVIDRCWIFDILHYIPFHDWGLLYRNYMTSVHGDTCFVCDRPSLLCNQLQIVIVKWQTVSRYVFELAVIWMCCWTMVGKKASTKAPKIQRLVTPLVLQRKRHRLAQKRRRATKKREEAAEYQKLLAQRLKEAKERKLERRRTASHSKSSITRTDSTSSAGKKWKCTLDSSVHDWRAVVCMHLTMMCGNYVINAVL